MTDVRSNAFAEREALLNHAQSDRQLRRRALRLAKIRRALSQYTLFGPDPSEGFVEAPAARLIRHGRIGETFRVLQYCTQHLSPDQPRALAIRSAATSLLLEGRTVRFAVRALVASGYLHRHGTAQRQVGLYTIAVVRNGRLVAPYCPPDPVPEDQRAA